MIGGEGTLLNLKWRTYQKTAPYGTGLFVNAFQAVNCQATFIQSLWDKTRTHSSSPIALSTFRVSSSCKSRRALLKRDITVPIGMLSAAAIAL